MHLRRTFACLAVVLSTAVAAVPAASAQNNSQQTGLVNVSLGDVSILNNVNLAVAANIAATVCNVNVPVAVLAQQNFASTGDAICDTTAGPLTVEQALNGPQGPGGGGPNAGGNNSQQTGLINISIGDIDVLNNVNLAVAANVAATVCNVNIPIAVLAVQNALVTGDAVCETTAGPLTVTQSQ
jgi:hypothetical protein